MTDDAELTDDDKRVLKRLADAARGEWPNRRQALGGGAAILSGAALGLGASQSVGAQPTGDEGQTGQSGNPVEVWASEIDATEIATDNLTTNNEVLVKVEKDSNDQINLSSGSTYHKVVWDVENDDVTNDFDLANDQFTPPESGYYQVTVWVGVQGFSDQDRMRYRFQNVTDGTTPGNGDMTWTTSGPATQTQPYIMTLNLTSGKNYEFQVRDRDSSFTISSLFTQMSIERVVKA